MAHGLEGSMVATAEGAPAEPPAAEARRARWKSSSGMSVPLFPIPPDSFKAAIQFHDFYAGDMLKPHPGVMLRTAALNHPGGATGYRLEYTNSAIAYITDTEHRPGVLDKNVLQLARDV